MIAIYSAIFLKEPFPRKEMVASGIAMLGVVFIARPAGIFGAAPHSTIPSVSPSIGDGHPIPTPPPTPNAPPNDNDDEARQAAERLMGIALGILSAVAGAGALITVKRIGTRVSVLTTTSFFALISTLVTAAAMLFGVPGGLRFALPRGGAQWGYVGAITACGLATQLLLTRGLSSGRGGRRAPAMLYTGMLWTAVFDRVVFGKSVAWTSVVGCGLIVGGAVFIVLQPKQQEEGRGEVVVPPVEVVDVEAGEGGEWVFEFDPLELDSDLEC